MGTSGSELVTPGTRRERMQARLSDGRIFEAVPGTVLGEVIRAAFGDPDPPIVAAIVDGHLRELTWPLLRDVDVTVLTTESSDGARIYRRSLAFLMLVAVDETFPETDVYIEHSATTAAGYFCEIRGRESFSQDDLDRIGRRMRELVDADVPIVRTQVPMSEAIERFTARGEMDKVRLLSHRARETVVMYSLRGRHDYFQGYMVPSTGLLRRFALHAVAPGFLLQFPHQRKPTELVPLTPYPKLFALFEQAGDWLDRLGIRSAGALNDAIAGGRLPEVTLVAEALHEARVAQIAAAIAERRSDVRIVLVAGPSSSGKTTFSKRLAVQLLAHGVRPMPLALDDYFVDRERTPRDAKGEYDYETIHALDLDLLNRQLMSLTAGEPTTLPKYDFLTGKQVTGPTVTLDRGHVVIAEGIHGLNPLLVDRLPAASVYRVYVSALTQLNLDRHNRVSTSDTRLVRRTVRDARSRGYTAAQTLHRWQSVVHGEKVHIFCFQENADAIFNSSLMYELSVLRPLAEPLLLQVRHDTPEYLEANRLLSFLQWFRPAGADVVPDNSILREFVGGSILEPFRLWPTDGVG
ncbi:MAG: nucleoside kinase [Acidobacteriota bacterium]